MALGTEADTALKAILYCNARLIIRILRFFFIRIKRINKQAFLLLFFFKKKWKGV